jgi:alpha-ketoglutarate-dependent taurine dioxygenase
VPPQIDRLDKRLSTPTAAWILLLLPRAMECGGRRLAGVDLTRPLPAEQLQEVRDAFLKWKVVFFRGRADLLNAGREPRRRLCRVIAE